jgi:hypothetical protein
MEKKDAVQRIIYILKEMDDTRQRLAAHKEEHADIELALLNQQVLNLYQAIQNVPKGNARIEYAPKPSYTPPTPSPAPAPKQAEPVAPREEYVAPKQEEPVRNTYRETPIAEAPAPVAAPETLKPHEAPDYGRAEPVSLNEEVKRDMTSSTTETLRKDTEAIDRRRERLQKLEEENRAAAAAKEQQAQAAKTEDFTKVVEEKMELDDAVASGEIPPPKPAGISKLNEISRVYEEARQKAATAKNELSLNEKLSGQTEQASSLNERLATQQESKKNLAEKLKLAPISDLKSAISLNQKVLFINQLFNGDDKEFQKVVKFVNGCRNFSEAKFFLQSDVSKQFNWQEDNATVEEFMELVYRKFL